MPVANVHAAMPPTSIRTSILSPMQSKEWMLAGGGAQVQEQYMRRRIRNAGSDLPVLMTLRCVRLRPLSSVVAVSRALYIYKTYIESIVNNLCALSGALKL